MNGLKIYTDGASRNNPGEAAWAYIIVDGMSVIKRRSGYMGIATNNVAEYMAIIKALSEAKKYTKMVEVYSDSQLVINQINGKYKINLPHLQKLCAQVNKLRSNFSQAQFISVSRDNSYIKEADKLCNRCIDKHVN